MIAADARPGPPTGTVTFLMTDIEGSTRLVLALGAAAWAPILERHRAVLRAAMAPCGGIEVQTEGDSLFAVFARAPAAVAAAAAMQKAMAAEAWPAEAVVKVRIGLHTGDGVLDADGSYVGSDVHRAARIASAAHGGQVVLSDSTRALVAAALPGGVGLMDLGEHRLKDLRSERLFQLRIDGIPCAFPPLRSLDARPNNLPTQLTSFIGREAELDAVAALLRRTRLLTLIGPGGTGKTRLSLQLAGAAADDYPDGVWFVALEPIRDPELVAPAIARAMGFSVGARPAFEVLAEGIGTQRILLVLDNFEQVIAGAAVVAKLLRACAELRVVVTSRAALRVSGEQEYPVPGLPAPPDTSGLSRLDYENLPEDVRHPAIEALTHYEAVRLFIARAVAVRPGFAVTNDNAPAVAGICARLHGMPLAIELAAARIKLLSPEQILSRLEKQLTLLTSGARDVPERQQTLRGAIAWSYDLLDEDGRRFVDRLSVFSGGWDIDAADAVTHLPGEPAFDVFDGLSALVDQSLVRGGEAGGEPHFEMFPTIREFAAERLAVRDNAAMVAERHARHFLAVAEQARPNLAGKDQRLWLDRLERNHDNLRAALEWAVARPEPAVAARLGFLLWRLWQQRGYLDEARARLDGLVAAAAAWPLTPTESAHLMEALGGIAYWQADHAAASAAYGAALALWRTVGDRRELANALYNRSYADLLAIMATPTPPAELAAVALRGRGGCGEALAIYRELGDAAGEGNVLWALGSFHYFLEELDAAEASYREALAKFAVAGDQNMAAWAQHMLALTAMLTGDTGTARTRAVAALRRFHAVGDLSGMTMGVDVLTWIAAVGGDQPRAVRLRAAARKLDIAIGAQLARYVQRLLEARYNHVIGIGLSAEDMARHAAEGEAMPLDRLIAYALEETAAAPR